MNNFLPTEFTAPKFNNYLSDISHNNYGDQKVYTQFGNEGKSFASYIDSLKNEKEEESIIHKQTEAEKSNSKKDALKEVGKKETPRSMEETSSTVKEEGAEEKGAQAAEEKEKLLSKSEKGEIASVVREAEKDGLKKEKKHVKAGETEKEAEPLASDMPKKENKEIKIKNANNEEEIAPAAEGTDISEISTEFVEALPGNVSDSGKIESGARTAVSGETLEIHSALQSIGGKVNEKNSVLPDSPGTQSGEKNDSPKLFVIDQRPVQKSEKANNFKGTEKGVDNAGEIEGLIKKSDGETILKGANNDDTALLRQNENSDGQRLTGKPVQEQVYLSMKDRQQLLEQLKTEGNKSIIKQTGIILKKNSSGEIRLVLKPERLGDVKIRINLQDNNVAGKIIVENNTVKEIFEHNLDNLYRAFRESGFQTGTLEVSVGNGGQGKNNQHGQHEKGRVVGMGKLEENLGFEGRTGFSDDYTVDLVV